jgi:hypothetical protein
MKVVEFGELMQGISQCSERSASICSPFQLIKSLNDRIEYNAKRGIASVR